MVSAAPRSGAVARMAVIVESVPLQTGMVAARAGGVTVAVVEVRRGVARSLPSRHAASTAAVSRRHLGDIISCSA
jgi:hypothetical protein